MARKKLVLVDGNAMYYRAFYAIPARLTNKDGVHTNAIYGFATMFKKLFAGKKPSHGAVVFDPPGPSFRQQKYAAYKATRKRMPDELREQVPYIDKLVAAHNFPALRVSGYEADDVIGTLATQGKAAGYEVVIVSSDKDFAQLIDDDVRMLDTLRDITYNAELVRKKWGVPPSQIVDMLSLWGDASDNIPGVPGIGKKGAAVLLEKYGSLENLLDHIDDFKGKRRENLENFQDDARMSKELATIVVDVPLDTTLDDLAITPPKSSALNDLYKELEFFSLLTDEDAASVGKVEKMDFRTLASAEEVRAYFAELGSITAIEPIFDGTNPATGALVGFAVSDEEKRAAYVPYAGTLGALGEDGMRAMRPFLLDGKKTKIAHNAKFVIGALAKCGIDALGLDFDIMLASFLVEPTAIIPHHLSQVSKQYLQRVVRPEKGVRGSGQKQKRFAEVDTDVVGDYACHRAETIFALYAPVKEKLEATGLSAIHDDMDLPLSHVLADMEASGIRVDPAELVAMGAEFHDKLDDLTSTIHKLAGSNFNIASTKQLSKVLFEDLGLPVIKRTKTGYSTNAEVLERLAAKGHQIATALLAHRKLAKLINTYTDVLSRAVDDDTGRVHTTFQQTAGATGRLITTDPDLQRTPVRTPEGARIRETFAAAPSRKIVCADWSQIELRILAHMSEDAILLDCFARGIDVHRRTASEIFAVDVDAVTKAQREVGKTINFATIYGQGATALGQMLKVKRTEAKAYIDGYFATYSGVRDWLDATIATALDKGYVETLIGRRRYIPELSSNATMDQKAGERIAANTPIQGSAADICKTAMLGIHARFAEEGIAAKMVLQIHDELLFDTSDDEVDVVMRIVREEMEQAAPLLVPLVVDIAAGQSWGEAKAA